MWTAAKAAPISDSQPDDRLQCHFLIRKNCRATLFFIKKGYFWFFGLGAKKEWGLRGFRDGSGISSLAEGWQACHGVCLEGWEVTCEGPKNQLVKVRDGAERAELVVAQ